VAPGERPARVPAAAGAPSALVTASPQEPLDPSGRPVDGGFDAQAAAALDRALAAVRAGGGDPARLVRIGAFVRSGQGYAARLTAVQTLLATRLGDAAPALTVVPIDLPDGVDLLVDAVARRAD